MKRKWALVTTSVITATLAIVAGELFLRAFFPSHRVSPGLLKAESLEYVPAVFARHAFPQREQVVQGWPGVTYRINRQGYRGADFVPDKPASTTRIIIYGGSSVFDLAAPEGKDWPHQVEQRLRAQGFADVEVINAGIPGHASSDDVGRLFTEGHCFQPDILVLYTSWNDIKFFRKSTPIFREVSTYDASRDPRLTYQNAWDCWFSTHSRFYSMMRLRYFTWSTHVGPEGSRPEGQIQSTLEPSALSQFRLNVQLFADIARNIGAVPVLMTEARLVSRNNTEAQKARIKYEYQLLTHEALCQAFEQADAIIREVAKEKGAYFIDASQALTMQDGFFRDHTHLTEKGSEALATLTAKKLVEFLAGKQLHTTTSRRQS